MIQHTASVLSLCGQDGNSPLYLVPDSQLFVLYLLIIEENVITDPALNDGQIAELCIITAGTIYCMSRLLSFEARTKLDIEDACSKHQLGSIEGRWRIM